MSATGVYFSAAGCVLVVLVLAELIARLAHTRFLSTVVKGKDGRTSTSKTFVFMWTLLVGWGLIALLIAGELLGAHGCVPAPGTANPATQCKARADDVGLLQVGWQHFLDAGLSGAYLVLLGVPAAAAVAAKGITQSEVTGSGFKTPNTSSGPDPAARLAEVFSADDGTTDIGDFQYMLFNLVAAVYFAVQFVNPDGSGLPTMPDTLLGLTSVSAALYVGKKAVTNSQPAIAGVFPQPVQANTRFTITGEGLVADPASPTGVSPQVTVDGVPALAVTADGQALTAVLPPALAGGGTPRLRHLQVKNPYNGITAPYDIQCL